MAPIFHQNSMSFSLPVELLCHILAYLPALDLLTCTLTTSHLRKVILTSSRLQYTIELAKARLVPLEPPTAPSYAARLALLQDRERAWRTMRWKGHHTLRLPPTGSVYEFVGGLYANGREDDSRVTGSISFLELPGADAGGEQDLRIWTHPMGGITIIDFTMDPSQDLLVLVALAPLDAKHIYELHLRSILTNEPHPRAPLAILPCLLKPGPHVPLGEVVSAVRVQVAGDQVALLVKEVFDSTSAYLEIYSWMYGPPHYSCSMSHIGIDDFTFLSPTHFLLARPTGKFEVYAFTPALDAPTYPVMQACYAFPPLADGYTYWYISMSSNPAPGYVPRRSPSASSSPPSSSISPSFPFASPSDNGSSTMGPPANLTRHLAQQYYPSPGERIHACCLYVFNPALSENPHVHSFVFFVNVSTLLKGIEVYGKGGEGCKEEGEGLEKKGEKEDGEEEVNGVVGDKGDASRMEDGEGKGKGKGAEGSGVGRAEGWDTPERWGPSEKDRLEWEFSLPPQTNSRDTGAWSPSSSSSSSSLFSGASDFSSSSASSSARSTSTAPSSVDMPPWTRAANEEDGESKAPARAYPAFPSFSGPSTHPYSYPYPVYGESSSSASSSSSIAAALLPSSSSSSNTAASLPSSSSSSNTAAPPSGLLFAPPSYSLPYPHPAYIYPAPAPQHQPQSQPQLYAYPSPLAQPEPFTWPPSSPPTYPATSSPHPRPLGYLPPELETLHTYEHPAHQDPFLPPHYAPTDPTFTDTQITSVALHPTYLPANAIACRAPTVPWERWGPQSTRWFEERLSTDWQHAIWGLRTVESVKGRLEERTEGDGGDGKAEMNGDRMFMGWDHPAPVAGGSHTHAQPPEVDNNNNEEESENDDADDGEGPWGAHDGQRHLRIRDFNPYSRTHAVDMDRVYFEGDAAGSLPASPSLGSRGLDKGKGKACALPSPCPSPPGFPHSPSFLPPPPSSASPTASPTNASAWRPPRLVTEPSITPARGVFRRDIKSWLPYTEVVSKETYDVTDVMMDDCRLLLLKRGRLGKLKRVDVLTL